MTRPLTSLGFDADDTLWHNERFFRLSHDRFAELLADHSPRDRLMSRLLDAERRNLGHYGYGIKGFTLSMIETAIEVTQDRVPATVIREILDTGREMLSHPIELLPGAGDAIAALAPDFTLVLITKGDLLDQERKLAQSGLGDMFDAVEIVSEKTALTYKTAFNSHGSGADRAMMVGNSVKSDVIPAIEAGAWAVHVPHDVTWALEQADAPDAHPRFRQIESLKELPDLIGAMTAKPG